MSKTLILLSGGMDSVTRNLAVSFTEALGQSVIVDNRPGAGSLLAMEIVSDAAADGHTLMMGAPQAVKDALAASVPFPKRLGMPEEYAKLAMTMIECGYFNGEDVRLDGAIRMQPR